MTASIRWEIAEGILRPYAIDGEGRIVPVTWTPQAGSQEAFLSCPVHEVLYSGTRGPGKTDALLMDFGQHVGQGFGEDWRGILFRRTFPELEDVISKSKKWFPKIWPEARYNESKHEWRWPSGERLLLRHILREADYYSYHGHEYPWIGWEELTNWASDKVYKLMLSCNRCRNPKAPLKIRSTCNPYGAGHNWVKDRWRLPIPAGRMIGPVIQPKDQPTRVCIQGYLRENRVLLHSNPNYVANLRAAARNPNELKAWLAGDWNIVAGGMFDDLWNSRHHVVPNLAAEDIPAGWRIDRSYDHGQSAPFSVGWWAESNGEPIEKAGRLLGPIRGDLIRIQEWYGWNGTPNEGLRWNSSKIAKGIVSRETLWRIRHRVKRGPADSQIFNKEDSGKSIAETMQQNGVAWDPADKEKGSRKQGWERIREYLEAAIPDQEGYREKPGLFICEGCEQFMRTFIVLPRDDKDQDDVDTETEDHIGDEVRYRVRHKRHELRRGKTK